MLPFIFVPHGDPLPLAWMADHPGWVKFPATMVPRAGAAPRPPPDTAGVARAPQEGRSPGGAPWDVPDGMRKPGAAWPAEMLDPSSPAAWADFVAGYNHVSRLIGAPLLAEPAGFLGDAGQAASRLLGIPPADAQEVPEELPEEEPPLGPDADAETRNNPQLESEEPAVRLLQARELSKELQRLEPDNPAINTLSAPNPVPTQEDVARLRDALAEALARKQRLLERQPESAKGFAGEAALTAFQKQLFDYMFEGDGFHPLGPYAAAGSDFSRSSLIVLDKPGPEMVFVAMTTQSSPFDIAMFRALDGGHLDLRAEAMRVPLAHVQIAALMRSPSVTLRISDILLT